MWAITGTGRATCGGCTGKEDAHARLASRIDGVCGYRCAAKDRDSVRGRNGDAAYSRHETAAGAPAGRPTTHIALSPPEQGALGRTQTGRPRITGWAASRPT